MSPALVYRTDDAFMAAAELGESTVALSLAANPDNLRVALRTPATAHSVRRRCPSPTFSYPSVRVTSFKQRPFFAVAPMVAALLFCLPIAMDSPEMVSANP
ncbi:predicted protein [Histoplasma capsulatum G186AR]|uniref:Uncharacterized protein n=1 Tax=Ajellomyces capsulatus (strain G186AR / H82 / ATCC MYA-2454 / RMSCC 2432) TaxID=447093 RepID=C0NNK1_AJECG|nr:uncharacterized protein HCBG_04731 [Histoplasma capsulatum G186AR]EEH06511.1 predicted protein [Histoplasma capsulatum G186AR]